MSKEPPTKTDKIANWVFWGAITSTVVMLVGNLLGWSLSWWVVFAPVLVVLAIFLGCIVILVLGFGIMAYQASRGD